MAITQRRSFVRRAVTASAVAMTVTLLGASSPIASAAPAAGFTSLDNPANWAIAKAAAASGYAVPAKYAASCGALQ